LSGTKRRHDEAVGSEESEGVVETWVGRAKSAVRRN